MNGPTTNSRKTMIQSNAAPPARVTTIQRIVGRKYSVSAEELQGNRRSAPIAHPRQVAMYLACLMTRLSDENIGLAFGGRSHATVVHARRRIAEKIRRNRFFSKLVNGLQSEISAAH